ncbi:uncharacterized protein PADG_04804 [Paracoccidioides brasiliensis Pb18]|uniref:Uncharacterized protein n=1 Tax=Paracoccidioides brasiliensis (strain Pb18) TaxID=502780 RepID=C1GCT2_PARBD|nr:uncharacterized protein PADG_04804 [Paracoccidioides brasiliensis Pb18]EEH48725.2 hypothetical protein PADG_04804 [Paracoccidioides brasiliensis Pb18]
MSMERRSILHGRCRHQLAASVGSKRGTPYTTQPAEKVSLCSSSDSSIVPAAQNMQDGLDKARKVVEFDINNAGSRVPLAVVDSPASEVEDAVVGVAVRLPLASVTSLSSPTD